MRLQRALVVSVPVTVAFASGLVAESIISPTAATVALTITLGAATITAWINP